MIGMTHSIKNIGYIGMGVMGAPMAERLMKAGFAVTVWNRTADKCGPLAKLGASVAASPAAMAAAKPDLICMNVTDTPDVEHVLFGADGVACAAACGLIVIDHSTINPIAAQQFAARLNKQGVTLLDAPVSGGDVGAQNGALSIMVGGDAEAFARCKPVFKAVGKAVTHVGDSGMGQTCKACNQAAVVCTLLGACEAIALAKRMGLDVDKMIEVVSAGAGGSWQLANLGPKIAAEDYAPGFMVDLVLKDLGIVIAAAKENNLDVSGVELAHRYFKLIETEGGGRLGTQAMVKALGPERT